MKFVMFTFEGSNNIGGVARMCTELTCALRQAGHEVTVPVDQLFDDGVRMLSNRRTPRPDILVRSAVALRRSANGARVICGQWYPDGVVALLVGVRPTVTLGHGSELMPSKARWRRGLWNRLRAMVFHRSQLVVCSSAYSRDLVLRAHPEVNAKAIPLGVDIDQFTPGDRESARRELGIETPFVVSTVARLYRFKGHETVFRALASLPPDKLAQFTYLIAGTGPDRELLESEVARLGLQAHVRWLGYVPDDRLPQVYQASDLFALCTVEEESRQEVEGFGLVFLESQACGTPVVGTGTGGIPDAVKIGTSGWLIAQDDSGTLSGILEGIVDDPDVVREMGVRARQHVLDHCTWANYVDRFVDEIAPDCSSGYAKNMTRPGDPNSSMRSKDSINP